MCNSHNDVHLADEATLVRNMPACGHTPHCVADLDDASILLWLNAACIIGHTNDASQPAFAWRCARVSAYSCFWLFAVAEGTARLLARGGEGCHEACIWRGHV